MRVKLSSRTLRAVRSAMARAATAFAPACRSKNGSRAENRAMGLAGEAAAAIFLDNDVSSFITKCGGICAARETPDVATRPNLEIKTVPNLPAPHFALGSKRDRAPKRQDYLVFRRLSEALYQVEGWLPADAVEQQWEKCGSPRFPSGTPTLPCAALRPASTCPWRATAS